MMRAGTPAASLRGLPSRVLFATAAVLSVMAAACTTTHPRSMAEPPASARSPGTEPRALRTMTFNIRYGTAPDGEHVWSARRDLVFHVIRDYGPHVLGLQEALRFQLDELAAEFPGYAEIGVGRDDGAHAGEYSAILYDRTRLEPLEQGTFWLSDLPQRPGSMTWGNRYPRVVTWARFHESDTGATFYVYNTHWDHESERARDNSARLMLERIRSRAVPADPVLVMGDFNAGEDDAAFLAMLRMSAGLAGGGRLYDTFRAAHRHAAGTGTYHAFRGDASGPKIDAVLASPEWRTVNAAIVRFSRAGLYPSDHFPVTATVLLRTAR